jgi:zinc/manganese transport system permease protein
LGAVLLTWSEKRWPEVQEATIGVAFIVAASIGILLLAGNPHGGEHLKDLLVGQILWVNFQDLPAIGLMSVLVLAVWFAAKDKIGRAGFYLLFACAVTFSVQLVGLYLVFATLIVPALATRHLAGRRLPAAWLLAASGYLLGLIVSALSDLPSGAVIVCAMTAIGALSYALLPIALR